MKSLFVAWQDPQSRQWAPVGRLSRDDGQYRFVYTRGAKELPNFTPFGLMTDLQVEYVSDELFPLFANRIFEFMSLRRPSIILPAIRHLGMHPAII